MGAKVTLPIQLVPVIDPGALARAMAEAQRATGTAGKVQLLDARDVQRQAAAAGAALKPVHTELGVIADEAQKVRDAMGRMARGAQEAGSAGGEFVKAFQFNQVTQAVQQVSATLQELSQPFIALDTATAQMRALGGEAGQLAPRLREAAIAMSRELPISAAEGMQSMKDALASGVQGGWEALRAFGEVAARLAIGGGSSMAEATTLLAGQLNAYGLQADQAGRVSDILFNTVNAGVTTIEELSRGLAEVVPTAAGAKIELDSIGGALALMTQKGIPTAQSTTKLNQLLIELQKPAAGLAPILREAGVSLDSLAKEDLVSNLGRVKLALDATGKSAVQVFGSSEAAAAFQTLTGDMEAFRSTFESVRDTTGSTAAAFDAMRDSIEVGSQGMLHGIQSFVIEGLDKVGPAFLGIVQSGTQIAPIVTSLAGLKELLPIEAAGKFASSLASKVLPALEALGIVRVKNAVAAGTDAAAEITDTAAKITNTAATQGQTVAQYGLNAAFLASPIGIITALAAAGGIAYALLSSSTKDLVEATKDASASMESFRSAQQDAAQVTQQATHLRELSTQYGQLQAAQTSLASVGGPTAATQAQLAAVSREMADAVPEAVVAMDGLGQAADDASRPLAVNQRVFAAFVAETERMAKLRASDALEQLKTEALALGDSVKEAAADQARLREESAWLQAQVAAGAGTARTAEIGNPFESMEDDLRDTTKDLAEVNALLKSAGPEVQKLVNEFQQEGFTVEEILQNLGLTQQQLERMGVKFETGLVPQSQAFRDAFGDDEAARRAVESASVLGKQFKDAQGNVDELNAKLAAAKFGGDEDLVKQIESDLAGAQKTLDEKRLAFKGKLDEEDFKRGVNELNKSGLGEELAPITVQAKVISDEAGFRQVQQDAGSLIGNIVDLQKQAATATDATNAKLVDSKVAAAQSELLANFRAQAEQVGRNQAELGRLREAKLKASNPEDVKRLTVQIAAMEVKTQDAAAKFVAAQKAAQGVGATKGDIRQLAVSFGEGSTAAKGTEEAVRRVALETRSAADEAGGLAAQFAAVRKSAESTLASLKGELVGIRAQMEAAQTEDEKKRLRELYLRKVEESKGAIKLIIDSQKIERQVEADLGVQNLQQLEARNKARRDQAARDNEARRKELADRRASDQKIRDAQRQAAIATLDDEFARALAEIALRKQTNDMLVTQTKGFSAAEIRRRKAEHDAAEPEIEQARMALINKYRGQGAKQILDLDAALGQQQIDQERATAETITSVTIAAIEERTRLLTGAAEREAALKMRAILAGDENVQKALEQSTKVAADAEIKARESLAAAQAAVVLEESRQLKLKEHSAADKARLEQLRATAVAARSAMEAARQDLAAAVGAFQEQFLAALASPTEAERQRLLAGLGFPDLAGDGDIARQAQKALEKLLNEIRGIQGKANREIGALVTKSQDEIAKIIEDAQRAGIPEGAERERDLRVRELQKTYKAEVEATNLGIKQIQEARDRGLINETDADDLIDQLLDRRLAADRHFRSESYKSDQSYYEQTNELARLAAAFESATRTQASAAISAAQRGHLEARLAMLQREDDTLEENYKAGLIRRDQYLDHVRQNAAEEARIHANLLQTKFDAEVAALELLKNTAAEIEKQKSAAVEAGVKRLTELSQAGAAFSADAGKAQLDLLRDFGIQTAAVMAQSVAQVLLEGGNALEAVKRIALHAIFDLAKKQITILAPSIIALFQSFIPPPFGLIAGMAAVGALNLGIKAAEGLVFKSKGGIVAPGLSPALGDVIHVMATPGEMYVNAADTSREREMLEWINSGKRSDDLLFRRFGHLLVDEQGRVMIGRMDQRIEQHERAIAELGEKISAGFEQLADSQDRMAHTFEERRFVEVSGQLELSGSDLVAALNEQTRLGRYR